MTHSTQMKILLTGGTGFFGRALLRHWGRLFLNGAGVPTVTLLTRTPQKFLDHYPEFQNLPWLRFHAGDILNPASLPNGQSFTQVFHAAADSTLGPQLTPQSRYDQIVEGTRNILNLAVASGASRFLLTSSGGVYGVQPAWLKGIPEDYCGMPDPLDPANAYGVAKRTAEHLCALYHHQYGLETVIARCFAFVGPDLPLDAHFAIGNFIRDALWRDEISVAGDGTAVRSYLDQRDLAVWLLALMERGQAGRAYNVGSDEAISIADLAYQVRDLVSPAKPVRILGLTEAGRRTSRYVPDISKAKTELGLAVTIPLMDAIANTAKTIVHC